MHDKIENTAFRYTARYLSAPSSPVVCLLKDGERCIAETVIAIFYVPCPTSCAPQLKSKAFCYSQDGNVAAMIEVTLVHRSWGKKNKFVNGEASRSHSTFPQALAQLGRMDRHD